MSGLALRAVGPAELDDLRTLFVAERSTRHCWCMAFCSSGWQFALGWYGGGNRRGFEQLARASTLPMGVLASIDGEPAGWCGCGPRARYVPADRGRSGLLAGRPRSEDDSVWLVACTYVQPTHRRWGVVVPLLHAAVSLAIDKGAVAIEAWPLAAGVRRPAEDHLGREALFTRLGFTCVERPRSDRAIMRRDFHDTGHNAPTAPS